jgi:hypothetical protein
MRLELLHVRELHRLQEELLRAIFQAPAKIFLSSAFSQKWEVTTTS